MTFYPYNGRDVNSEWGKCTARAKETIRKLVESYLDELLTVLFLEEIRKRSLSKLRPKDLLFLEKLRTKEFLAEVLLSDSKILEEKIVKIKIKYRRKYQSAMYQYRCAMDLSTKICKNLPLCPFLPSQAWAKCRIKQLEDLMTVQITAVHLAQDLATSIFWLSSSKPPGYLDYLLDLFISHKYRPHDTHLVKVFFKRLETEVNLSCCEDLTSELGGLLKQKEGEIASIIEEYDQSDLPLETCQVCPILPIWLDNSSERGPFFVANDMRALLICQFRYYFYATLEMVVARLQKDHAA